MKRNIGGGANYRGKTACIIIYELLPVCAFYCAMWLTGDLTRTGFRESTWGLGLVSRSTSSLYV